MEQDYFPIIKGEKVYLSPLNVKDLNLYTAWMNDPEIADNLSSTGRVWTLEKEREVLNIMAKEDSVYAIIKSDEDRLIGNCGLMSENPRNRTAEAGIMIGDKKLWGKGYGTEAMKLLVQFAFEKRNLQNIMLFVYEYNKRAIRSYEKIGFRLIGRRRKSKIINNKVYDTVYMDILPGDFYPGS